MPEDKPYIKRIFDFMSTAFGGQGKLYKGAFSGDFDTFYNKITTDEKYADKIYSALDSAYGKKGQLKKGSFTSDLGTFKSKVLTAPAPQQFPMAAQLMDFSNLGNIQPQTADPAEAVLSTATSIPQTLYRGADGAFKEEKEPGLMADIRAFDSLIQRKEQEDQAAIEQFNQTIFNTEPAVNAMTGQPEPLTDFQIQMKEYKARVEEFDKNLQQQQAKADEFAKTTAGGLYYSFIRPVYQTFENVGKNVGAGILRTAGGVGGGLGLENSERILNKTADGLADYFDFNRLAREGNPTGYLNLTPTGQQGKLSRANIIPKAMEAISSMASLMGNARLLGGNTPALFASSYLSTYEDYRNAAKNAGLSDIEADQFAITSAGVTSALEMISPNRFLLRPGELSSATKGVFRAIKDGIPVKQAVKTAFKGAIKEIGAENIQELSQLIGDKVVRTATDLATGVNRFNEASILPTANEALETIVLTSIATGVMSGRRVARNANPSNIERSAWAQAAEQPEIIEQGIEKGLANQTITEEQAGKIRQDVAEYKGIYDAVKAQLEETNPNADVSRIALDAFKSQKLKQETQPIQGIPALAPIQEQAQAQNDQLENNIKDELVGIPEEGTEVSSNEIKALMTQTGAEDKIGQVSANEYKAANVDLAQLYQTNEKFKSYVDQERLRPAKDEEGLRTPVVLNSNGEIVDGFNRLAQQYVNGAQTARAFVEMQPLQEEDSPLIYDEELGAIPVEAVTQTAAAVPEASVDPAKQRRDKAVDKLKQAWSAYSRVGIINDPEQNLKRDKEFYGALANYVKEELLYRVNQVKGFVGKKKAQMKRDIIKSLKDEQIGAADLDMLNDAFEEAYAEAKNIPGLLAEKNDRISYNKYIKDRIRARAEGRKRGTKEGIEKGKATGRKEGIKEGVEEGAELAKIRVGSIRAAIQETLKATGVTLSMGQIKSLLAILQRATTVKRMDKAIDRAIKNVSQMIWEAKNREKISHARSLISQAKKLKRNKNMVLQDVEWLQQVQLPNPNQVDDIDQYVEYLENFTKSRKGNKAVSEETRQEFQDFVDQENARIYSEKRAAWQADLDDLIANDILPSDVTLDEYIQLLEGQKVDRLGEEKVKKEDVLRDWIRPRLNSLKSATNEFSGPISQMDARSKDVVDRIAKLDIDQLNRDDLILLNNVLNNISEYGLLDGAGQLITTYEAKSQMEELAKSKAKLRQLPSQKIINKKNISNIISALFYNDEVISQFREKTLGGIENKTARVKDKAQNVIKEFVALNKKNKITAAENARLFAASYLNQYKGSSNEEISSSLRQKLSEMVEDVEYLYGEGQRLEKRKGESIRKDAQSRLDALQSLGLISYSISQGNLDITISEKFDESDPVSAINNIVNKLSAGEKSVYQFVMDRYSDVSDQLEFVTRTYANKEFRRERNYVSLVPRRKDGQPDKSQDISEETDFTQGRRSVNTKPATTTISRADRKGDNVYYDGDFFSNFVNRYYTSLYTSEVLPEVQRTAKLVNSKEFQDFITGKLDEGFRGKGAENYTKFKNKLAQVINDEKFSPFFQRGQSTIADALISRGVRAVLGNVWQGPKQYAPAVIHNFAVNNPKAVTFAMRSRGKALTDKQYANDRQMFLKNFTGVQRSAVGSEAYDRYIKSVNDDMSWWMHPVQWIDKVQKASSYVLERSDRAAQNDAYIGSYVTSLMKQGVIKNPGEFDFAQHAERPNKEALSYAEQMASNINNESAKAYRADALTQGDYAKYLWLLQGFSLNAYQNAWNKAKIIGDNRATGEEKKEAAYHFLGYLGEMASYQVVGKWARNSQLAIAGAILSGLFGITDDESEEEKRDRKKKEDIRTGASVLADISMSGLPAPAQAALKISLNYAYQQWAKIKVKEKKKEAGAKGEKFNPNGTYLSPYYVPFYGVEGPGGAADFYTAIGKKGIDAVVKGAAAYKSDEEDTANEQLATNLNRYLGIPAAVIGAGDLIILNSRMQQVIKNAGKDNKAKAAPVSSRNRRRSTSRTRQRNRR